MKPTNSGDLHTGINSGSFGNYRMADKKKDLKAKKQKAKNNLTPYLQPILDVLDHERQWVTNIESFILEPHATEIEIRNELNLRKRHLEVIKKLESKLKAVVGGDKL